jgi:hypothetical protein
VPPVVRVPGGRGRGKVTMAGLCCYRSGYRTRFFHTLHSYRGRKDETKSFTWRDYRNLLWRTHTQLGAPVILVWDNLSVHLHHEMPAFIERAD